MKNKETQKLAKKLESEILELVNDFQKKTKIYNVETNVKAIQ